MPSMNIQIVARHAGVSVATVSRAFNFPDKVAPATRALVERVAAELGYVANASARTLRTQRSRVLGVVLPTLLNPTFAECLQGIAAAAHAAGYAILPLTIAMSRWPSATRRATTSAEALSLSTDTQGWAGCRL